MKKHKRTDQFLGIPCTFLDLNKDSIRVQTKNIKYKKKLEKKIEKKEQFKKNKIFK